MMHGISSAKMRLHGWRSLLAAALLSVEELTYVTPLEARVTLKERSGKSPPSIVLKVGKKFINRSLPQLMGRVWGTG